MKGKKKPTADTKERRVAVKGVSPPHTHTEPYEKATVVFFLRQLVYLDHLRVEILADTGKRVSRAELLRALVDEFENNASHREAIIASLTVGRHDG